MNLRPQNRARPNGAAREPLKPRTPEPINAVFWGLNRLQHIYAGTRPLRSLPPRQGVGIGRVGELPRRDEPDPHATGPLQATIDRRRARNRAGRAQRRTNRIRGER